MFCLCCSAGAVSFSSGEWKSFSEFPVYVTSSSNFSDNNRVLVGAGQTLPSYNSNTYRVISVASGSASGSLGVSYFDYPNPTWANIHLRFSVKFNRSLIGLSSLPQISLYSLNGNSIPATVFSPVYNSSTGTIFLSVSTASYAPTLYDYTITASGDLYTFDCYFSAYSDHQWLGFGILYSSRPLGVSGSWHPDLDNFRFEVSNQRFLVPNTGSGGSGGSVDLSSITSQITSLSSQMTSSFNEVNANIDAAESSISNSIDNQTSALEVAISDAATDVTSGINDHFDSWDSQLSDAFSSDDGQAVVDANAAVSGVHQVEEDAIENAGNQLVDAGLDSYDLPADYKSSLGNMAYLLSLLFQSCSWITDLIIFSCTFGIAFVLIGRKSRGSE